MITFESKKVTKASSPTRGVPNVVALIAILLGSWSLKNSESSSAMAPPSEWPIYKSVRMRLIGDKTAKYSTNNCHTLCSLRCN